MWQERTSHLTLDQKILEEEKNRRKGKGREEESRERGSTLSLDILTIGPSVSGEARGKVLPRDKSC